MKSKLAISLLLSYLRFLSWVFLSMPKDMLIYNKIRRMVSIDETQWAFVCNAHLGDTYLLAALMPDFLSKTNSKEAVFIGYEWAKCLFSQFDMNFRFITVDKAPSIYWNAYSRFLIKFKKGNVLPGQCSSINPFRIKSNKQMLRDFSILTLHSDDIIAAKPKNSHHTPDYSNKYAYKFNEKAAILFPYSYTVKMIPLDFWKRVAENLTKTGYSVLFNIGPNEEKINGYQSVSLDLCELSEITESVSLIIGMRSGIIDLISNTKTPKIIIYSTERERDIFTVTQYNPELSNKILELVFDEATTIDLLEKIFPDPKDLERILI